ncbi:MAG: hypothetical protein V1913_09590 [Fibrobacterota bacterium]
MAQLYFQAFAIAPSPQIQSDIIQNAVDDLLARQGAINKSKMLDEIAGIWSVRKDIPDVRALRTGWRRRRFTPR